MPRSTTYKAFEQGARVEVLAEETGGPVRSEASTERLIALIDEASARFRRGQPLHHARALFREEIAKFWIDQLPRKYDWYTELAIAPEFIKLVTDSNENAGLGGIVQINGTDPNSVLATWDTQRLRSVSDTSNWFKLGEALTYQLLATDLKGCVIGDMRMPLDAFYVEIPPDVLWLEDQRTGYHEVRSMLLATGEVTERAREDAAKSGDPTAGEVRLGSRIVVELWGEPNEKSVNPFDDAWAFYSFVTANPEAPIEDALLHANAPRRGDYAKLLRSGESGKLGTRWLNAAQFREVVLNFVLNLCVYLGSPDARVEHVHKAEIDRIEARAKSKPLRKVEVERIKRLKRDRVFEVGSDVTVEPEVRESVRTGHAAQAGHALTYRTIVRGHWRNQAHGPGRTLRVRRWIQPHVRGADLPTKTVGHRYEVK